MVFHENEISLALAIAIPLPLLLWWLDARLARFAGGDGGEESAHGRDYYIGFTIGRKLGVRDVDELLRLLRDESYRVQLSRDLGGEKWFLLRDLPMTRDRSHDLEGGLLAGALFRATKERFEVDEERCSARGDGFCKFVAVRG